ncbi:pilus assembly protein TadG-related protein (plasmid) [Geminicoccaceae bacterium 1502E]|nr:pilus assembly protein TadG-related protein [Geminicoccaceae bacterium 1502E]
MLLPLVMTVGLAVDLSRAYLVQSRLITATDSAALAAARTFYEPSRDQRAAGFFWANFSRKAPGSALGFLDSRVSGPHFKQVSSTEIEVSATASMPTLFLRAAGYETIDVTATNVSQRAERGMELALVLDVTGSMAGSKIRALRDAATTLIDMIYGTRETTNNLWMAVVPYSASVNLGPSRTSWLRSGSLDTNAYYPRSWAGCVEARWEHGNDRNDLNPFQAPFEPYLYESTLGKYTKHGDDDDTGKGEDKDKGGGKAHQPVKGDNDWSVSNVTEERQASLGNNTVGPNLACPPPVMSLRQSKAQIRSFVQSLEPHYRGGTMANLGLQAGWFVLSPRWRGLWGDPALPRDYDAPNMDKVVILMTDGENNWYDWPEGAPGKGPPGWGNDGDADYTAYGRLKENRLEITTGLNDEAQAGKEIDRRMSALCTEMQSKGIIMYTITFAVNSNAVKKLYQGCASKPEYYFNSPDDASLKAAFKEIADQLMNVRLNR